MESMTRDRRQLRVFGPAYPYWADVPDWLEYARKSVAFHARRGEGDEVAGGGPEATTIKSGRGRRELALARLRASASAGRPRPASPVPTGNLVPSPLCLKIVSAPASAAPVICLTRQRRTTSPNSAAAPYSTRERSPGRSAGSPRRKDVPYW